MKDTERVKSLIEEKIIAPLKPLIEARNKKEQELNRLREALTNYTAKKDDLHAAMAKSIRESMEALAAGKSAEAKQKEVSKIKADIIEADEWIKQLTEVAIPQAQEAVKQAEEALRTKEQELLLALKQEVTQIFEKKISDAMDVFEVWSDTVVALKDQVGIRLTGDPNELRKFFDLTSKDSRLLYYMQQIQAAVGV